MPRDISRPIMVLIVCNIYIYIYIYREREREREISRKFNPTMDLLKFVTLNKIERFNII